MSVAEGKKDYLDILYDSFAVKDCTRRQFRTKYVAAMDPRGIRRDVRGMIERLQLRRKLSGG